MKTNSLLPLCNSRVGVAKQSLTPAFLVIPAQAGIHLVLTVALLFGAAQVGFGQVEVEWEGVLGDVPHDNGDQVYAQSLLPLQNGYAMAGWFAPDFGGTIDGSLWFADSEGENVSRRTFGGRGTDVFWSALQTNDNGFMLVGWTNSFGAGGDDAWLLKVNANGDSLWSRTFGTERSESFVSIIQMSDGGFILTGTDQGRVWVVKTNDRGELTWQQLYITGEVYNAIHCSDDGIVIVAYIRDEEIGVGTALLKIDSEGELVWTQRYYGLSYCRSVVQTANGEFGLMGTTFQNNGRGGAWLLRASDDGDSLWSQTYYLGNDGRWWGLVNTPDLGFCLAGFATGYEDEEEENQGGPHHGFSLIRTDKLGGLLWSFRTNISDGCYSIIETPDNEFVLAGRDRIIKTTPDPVIAHRIALRQGWNMISSVCPPANPAMSNVWSEVVSRGNLFLAKNQSGQFYMPGVFNGMAPWDVRQGYYAKLNEADTLVIVNVPTDVGTPIPLRQGWNLIAYFPEQDLDVRDALAGIVDDVILIKDLNGRFYRPSAGFSNMPPLTRGRGYQLGVSRAGELVYPAGEQRIAGFQPADKSVQDGDVTHFPPIPPTGANMSLLISTHLTARAGFQPGEIGVFTSNGRLIGSAVLEAKPILGLAIWGDDPSTEAIDGAKEGELLNFRFWDGVEEKQAKVTWLEGDGSYQSDGFAQIRIDGVTALIPTELALEEPYPNPFNSITTIRYSLPEASSVKLAVFDLSGREVATLANGKVPAGYHQAIWKAESQPSGIYFCRMEVQGFDRSVKLFLVK